MVMLYRNNMKIIKKTVAWPIIGTFHGMPIVAFSDEQLAPLSVSDSESDAGSLDGVVDNELTEGEPMAQWTGGSRLEFGHDKNGSNLAADVCDLEAGAPSTGVKKVNLTPDRNIYYRKSLYVNLATAAVALIRRVSLWLALPFPRPWNTLLPMLLSSVFGCIAECFSGPSKAGDYFSKKDYEQLQERIKGKIELEIPDRLFPKKQRLLFLAMVPLILEAVCQVAQEIQAEPENLFSTAAIRGQFYGATVFALVVQILNTLHTKLKHYSEDELAVGLNLKFPIEDDKGAASIAA